MSRASLAMYGGPAWHPAWSALWGWMRAGFAKADLIAPQKLDWPQDLVAHWRQPDLFLAQTCALPFRRLLSGTTEVLGSFDFALPGCPPGYYNSVLVAGQADRRQALAEFAGARWAMNDPMSQSGYAALSGAMAGVALGDAVVTGSHVASLKAVATGQAALAAIDAQTWRIAQRDGLCAGTREIGRTIPTRGLPLITARTDAVADIRDALTDVMAGAPRDLLAPLDIAGFVPATSHDYIAEAEPPAPHTPG